MSDTAAREQLRVGRQTVPLSNTGKVLFPPAASPRAT